MKKLLFLFLLSASINLNAQDLIKYLPENPLLYGRFALPTIFKSQPLDSLKEYAFFQAFMQEVPFNRQQDADSLLTGIINDIEKFGLSLNSDMHIVVSQEDSLIQSNIYFQINNITELEKNINLLFPVGDSTVYYSAANDFKLFIYKDLHMAWNNELFIVGARMSLRMETQNSWDLTDAEKVLQEKQLNERDANAIHKIFHANTLVAKRKYLKKMYQDAAIATYMDMKGLYNIYLDAMTAKFRYYGALNIFSPVNNALPFLDSKVNIGIYFNNDELVIKAKSKMGKELRKKLLKVYKRKYNPGIFNYVPEDALLSAGIKINTEAYINFTFDILADVYSKIPRYGRYGVGVITFLQTFMDEKGIGELVRGDMIFSLNNISKKNISYTTYDYDEDYNSTEVTKFNEYKVPSFSLIGSTGNPKQLEKLMDIGLDLSKVYVKENDVYVIRDNDLNQIGGALYIQITDKLFFVSNDSSFIYNVIPNKGYDKKLNAKAKKNYKGKTMYLDFSADKLMKSLADSLDEVALISSNKLLRSAAGKLHFEQSFSWFGVSTTLKYKTSDKSNVLPFLTECMNQYYLEQKNRYSYNDYDYESVAVDSAYALDSTTGPVGEPDELYLKEDGTYDVSAPHSDYEQAVEEAQPIKKEEAIKPKKVTSKK
ncbi:MAG: hypothetical protein NT150_15050 [Bacteroidetes bacterium]|nr:hypothetical protein [Bacteroidota bacterium]